MTTSPQARVHRGIPTGGQFAHQHKSESTLDLTTEAPTSTIEWQRLNDHLFQSEDYTIGLPGDDGGWFVREHHGYRVVRHLPSLEAAQAVAEELHAGGTPDGLFDIKENRFVGTPAQRVDIEGRSVRAVSATEPTPFTFDGDYDNVDQVLPYWADYKARYDELAAAGQYPYNASFKGTIPSLNGTDDKNEDTAIYQLQSIQHQAERIAKVKELEAAGYKEITEPFDGEIRGDVAYVEANGWRTVESARVRYDKFGYFILPKGSRSKGYRAHAVNDAGISITGGVRPHLLVKRAR